MNTQVRAVSHRKTLRRNLKAMNADGFSFSVMVGIAETYVPAFVLSRGLGDLTAAMVATVPVLLGSVLQLFAPLLLARLGSYRRFVVTTATIQACSMLTLMGLAFLKTVPAWSVFLPTTVYWAAGLATGPAWNTWVEKLVPARIRSGFFARRSRLCHVGVLAGLISGGLLLRWSTAHGSTTTVFAVLFGIGAVGRFISARMLARQTEVLPERTIAQRSRENGSRITTYDALASIGNRFLTAVRTIRRPGPAGRLVFFLMAVQTAVHVSGPYFNPFMLRILQLSWVDYMGLLSLGFIGKMMSLPWAGRFANRWGADKLLWLGSVGIVPISVLWYFSQSIWFLGCVQILSGLVWGCYELAMLLQFFRQIPGERRVAVLTFYNLGNSAAMVAGTLIGAVVVNQLGRTHNAYIAVFVASGVMRFAALLALPERSSAVLTTKSALRTWFETVVDESTAVSAIVRRRLRPLNVNAVMAPASTETPGSLPATLLVDTLSGAGDQSVILVLSPSREDSSVSARPSESGSAVPRRRDVASGNHLPARVDPALTLDLTTADHPGPRE